jgi:hypothetical protein
MARDETFEDGEHFVEGLVHLADMLELADPRRKHAQESQEKIQRSGVAVPVGRTYEEWRAFCLGVVSRLRKAYATARTDAQRATLDAAIQRIEQVVE